MNERSNEFFLYADRHRLDFHIRCSSFQYFVFILFLLDSMFWFHLGPQFLKLASRVRENRPRQEKKLLVTTALWSRTSKNPDVSTGLLTLSFTPSLAPLTHWLAPPCSLCSGVPLRSFVHSLPFSLTPELVGKRMIRI